MESRPEPTKDEVETKEEVAEAAEEGADALDEEVFMMKKKKAAPPKEKAPPKKAAGLGVPKSTTGPARGAARRSSPRRMGGAPSGTSPRRIGGGPSLGARSSSAQKINEYNKKFVEQLKAATKDLRKTGADAEADPTLELGLLLDCTASMGSWIKKAKETIHEIIDNVIKEC